MEASLGVGRAQALARWRPRRVELRRLHAAAGQATLALVASRLVVLGFALPAGHWSATAPFDQWDAAHYLTIAQHGYPAHVEGNWAFYPLYPVLARSLWIGVLISVASFWLALVLIHRLAELDAGAGAGRRAVWIAAFFPASYFFTAYYSEGLFLALSAGALLALRRGRLGVAAWLSVDAALTRSLGAALALPLLAVRGKPLRSRLVAACGPLVAIAAFFAFAYAVTGDALAPIRAQQPWGRAFHGPFAALLPGTRDAWVALRGGTLASWGFEPGWMRIYELALVALAVGAVVGLLRRFPREHGLYVLGALALPLSVYWPEHPLMSFPRFLAALAPLYLWMGARLRGRALLVALVAQTALLALFSWRFGAGMWAG